MEVKLSKEQQDQITTALNQQFDVLTAGMSDVLKGIENNRVNVDTVGQGYNATTVSDAWSAVKRAWIAEKVRQHLINLQSQININLNLDRITSHAGQTDLQQHDPN